MTTDFGTRDWFVGAMKGVILGLRPLTTIVDISHEVPPGDIHGGAFALAASYAFFPKGAVHIAVVDPGVGSVRKALAVQTAEYLFVGPDNGVLFWALAREKVKAVHRLENEDYFRHLVSRTFHGRDIFAPVAAHLSGGVSIKKLGPAAKGFVRLDWPKPGRTSAGFQGEVVYVDRFGNAITNFDAAALRGRGRGALRVSLGRKGSCPVTEFYQSVPRGKPLAVLGSSGFLEVAVNGGSAAQVLGLKVGDVVTMREASRAKSR